LTPEEEVNFAAKLHYSFLPDDLDNEHLDIAAKTIPYREIGGDYFAIMPILDSHTMVCYCDVTGHSVISALLAARVNTYITTHMEPGINPCELIEGLNEYLCKHISNTGTFTSYGSLLISHNTNEIIFGGAALPPVLHYNSANKTVETLKAETIFLGAIHPLPVPCITHTRKIDAGDKIILCTDGIIEVENGDREMWGLERLIETVENYHQLPSIKLNDMILQSLNEYSNNQFNDDLTLISISIKQPEKIITNQILFPVLMVIRYSS